MSGLLACLWKLCVADHAFATAVTRPGQPDAVPDEVVALLVPGPRVAAAVTGPDEGIAALQQQDGAGLGVVWQQQGDAAEPAPAPLTQQQAPTAGQAVSLYDASPAGGRMGDPVADCFGAIAYDNGSLLALCDGVSWGAGARRAAQCAVYGFLQHMHERILELHGKGQQTWSSHDAFAVIRAAVRAAHQQVVSGGGTLTTLAAALVVPQQWGPGHSLLTVVVGDSPAYVWRARTARVEEVSWSAGPHGFHRDPRVCPGCLGHAIGDAPDLSNITYAITSVEEGDIVFLTSDGISDNYDPVVRKVALPSTPGRSPRHSLTAAGGNGFGGALATLSPASCHEMALSDMSTVLRAACQHAAQQQQQQQQQPGGGGKAAQSFTSGRQLAPALLVHALLRFVFEATQQQRSVLEAQASELAAAAAAAAAQGGGADDGAGVPPPFVDQLIPDLPGKLDHASVVAFRVGPKKKAGGGSASGRRRGGRA